MKDFGKALVVAISTVLFIFGAASTASMGWHFGKSIIEPKDES